MATANNRFQKGSGCFTCYLCGKRTRQTGKYSYVAQDACDKCIEYQEHENALNDNHDSWTPEVLEHMTKEFEKMEKEFKERVAKNTGMSVEWKQ